MSYIIKQRFPTFFYLPTPWQPISINCALYISKMFVINLVAVHSFIHSFASMLSHLVTMDHFKFLQVEYSLIFNEHT